MGKRVFLAAGLLLLSSAAWAQHAVTIEPEAPPQAVPTPPPAPPAPPPAAAPAPQPAPNVDVSFPSELDVYLVPAATRQVCTTGEWGYGEVRSDCRTTPVPIARPDPALRGLCITRYGHRRCY